jgi:hypothetical protein
MSVVKYNNTIFYSIRLIRVRREYGDTLLVVEYDNTIFYPPIRRDIRRDTINTE